MEVVINSRCGGFRLSQKALEWLYKKQSLALSVKSIEKYFPNEKSKGEIDYHVELCGLLLINGCVVGFDDHNHNLRSHPDIVGVVKALGVEADTDISELKIVQIPDDTQYSIDEYRGQESIHQSHTIWS